MVKLRKPLIFFTFFFLILILPGTGYCADTNIDGTLLSVVWTLPFVGLLGSIAVWPLVRPGFWHDHYGKISFFWSLTVIIPLFIKFGLSITTEEMLNTFIITYAPFIILLTALFAVTGGIHLEGKLVGKPLLNTFLLFLGAFLASWTGTTGASMLLIRPLLQANTHRKYRVHTVIFFIILVGNIGGSLTPLGDPPLFVAFLQGMDFFWPTKNMLGPMLYLCVCLLIIHFLLDSFLFKREGSPVEPDDGNNKKLALKGWQLNFPLLALIAVAVLLSGIWKPGVSLPIFGSVAIKLQDLARDIILIAIIFISGRFTPLSIRENNFFNWEPMKEVAKLFIAIFICLIPMIAILKAGENGPFAFIFGILNSNGEPNNVAYFWMTGILSTFLDNTPTFLLFFNIAGGDAQMLMTTMSSTLLAVTMGTVFMGANTYISNAPNLMIKNLAEGMGVTMPSFFVYMFIVMAILFPLFIVMNMIFL